MNQAIFPNRLPQFRRAAGILSQGELSRRLQRRGLRATPAHIQLLEAGKRRPSLTLMFAIADELGVDRARAQEIFLPPAPTVSQGTGTNGN